MPKEKLIITVSGRVLSGKSRLSFLLKEFLRKNGFDVKHEVSLDFQNENHFNKAMSEDLNEVFESMKERCEIYIREEQLREANLFGSRNWFGSTFKELISISVYDTTQVWMNWKRNYHNH